MLTKFIIFSYLIISICCILIIHSHNTSARIHIQIYAETLSTIMTNFNERTNALLYKNISLALYSWKGDVSYVWKVSGDKDGLLFWPKFFFNHSGISFSSWLGCSTMGDWRPKALCLPLALTSASCPQLTRTAPGTWLYYCLTPTCFRCSSAYLHRCISWLTTRSRVNI